MSSTTHRAADDALVRAARAGDEAAFAALVDRYGPGMYGYARRLLGDHVDAGEAVQEALVSAWKSLDDFEGRSHIRTWLYRLVHRRAVDLQRKRRPVPVEDESLSIMLPPARTDPLQQVLDSELLVALQAALETLPWNQRACWLLREIEEMSYDEIAEAIGLTEGSVRGHLQRARQALAERMAPWR